MPGWYRDQFVFRISQRGQLATKDAAGVNVDGVIQPFWLRDGRVTVNHPRLAPILFGPRVANRKTKLVRLASGLSEQRKFADLARAAPLHFFLHAGVSDHQLAVVEHVMADQS